MIYSRSKTLFFCCLSFLGGILIFSFLSELFFRFHFWYFASAIGGVFFLFIFYRRQRLRFGLFLFIFFFLAVWRYSMVNSDLVTGDIRYWNGEKVMFEGLVRDQPLLRGEWQRIEVDVTNLILEKDKQVMQGVVLVNASPGRLYEYGDILQISCRIQNPNAGNGGFAYDRYLARFGVYSVCYYPRIRILERGQGSVFYRWILNFKGRCEQIIKLGLLEPEAGLLQATILGSRGVVDEETNDNFSRAGLSHIVAISGTHFGILSFVIMEILLAFGFWRRHAFYFSSFLLFVYTILIGAPASAVRGGVMWFIALWAIQCGRLGKMTNALLFSAVVMLFFNPLLLRDDVGFQLSFLALLGIIHIYPRLDEFLEQKKMPKLFGIRDIFAATLAAQIFTLPVMAYNFSGISLIAPLANILVAWTFPFVMIFGLSALVVSFIFSGFATFLFVPAYLFLHYTVMTAQFCAKLPYAFILL